MLHLALSAKTIERSLLVCGAALCLVYLGVTAFRSASSGLAVRSLGSLTKAGAEPAAPTVAAVELRHVSAVDLRPWAATRVAAYKESLARQFVRPIAVLRVPKARIEVPVFDGTDELVLNRGVGRITLELGRPGELGKVSRYRRPSRWLLSRA